MVFICDKKYNNLKMSYLITIYKKITWVSVFMLGGAYKGLAAQDYYQDHPVFGDKVPRGDISLGIYASMDVCALYLGFGSTLLGWIESTARSGC